MIEASILAVLAELFAAALASRTREAPSLAHPLDSQVIDPCHCLLYRLKNTHPVIWRLKHGDELAL